MTRARVPQPAGIEATTVCAYSCGLSVARLVSPCLPPVPLLAPSIAVAGPNAPCSIAACRRTSPPGSNSPATAARALPVQPLSNVSSAGISNAGCARMALPAPGVPSAVTILSSPMRAFVQGPWCLSRLQHPANGRNCRSSGRPRFSATAGPPVGVVGSEAAALLPATRSGDRNAGAAHFPEHRGTSLAPRLPGGGFLFPDRRGGLHLPRFGVLRNP